MDLWDARTKASIALGGQMAAEASLIQEAFDLIDDCLTRLETKNTDFSRVCGITLIKARNLGLGCYSLCLDALAQEAGALLRPLIEALELLTYFRLDPSRITQAMEDRLPSAGQRARMIGGQLKQVRDYLNSTASHVGWTYESIRHLVDLSKPSYRVQQQFRAPVLRTNLRVLFDILLTRLRLRPTRHEEKTPSER